MSTVAEVIENWESLEFDDKVFTLEIMKKGLNESKRDALIKRVKEAKKNYSDGKIKSGSAKDLFMEMKNV